MYMNYIVCLSAYNITDAKLMLFGSSANEFGSSNSDIDISMKLPGNFEVSCIFYDVEFIMCHMYVAMAHVILLSYISYG